MNDHDRLHQLDGRAERAAADLRDRAERRPVPPFDPDVTAPVLTLTTSRSAADPGHPRLRSRRALAVAAAVALLAGAGAWAATSGDDGSDEGGVATVPAEGLRAHVATDLPDGYTLVGAFTLSGDGDGEGQDQGAGEPMPVSFYGTDDDDPQLAVASAGDVEFDDGSLGDPVDVGGGRTARTLDAEGFGPASVLLTGPDQRLVVTSPSLSIAGMAEVTEGAELTDTGVTLDEGAMPEGWRLLASEPDLVSAGTPLAAFAPSGAQHSAYYAGGPATDPTKQAISVTSLPGDAARLATARLLLDDVRSVDIDGSPGLLGQLSMGVDGSDLTLRTVAWLDGATLVRVAGFDVGEDELLRVARGVRPADADEWDELVRSSELGELSDDDGPEIARGAFADGTEWVLRVDGVEADGVVLSADLSVGLPTSGSFSSSSSGSAKTSGLLALQTLDQGGRHFASGLVSTDVAAVELRRPDGTVIERLDVLTGAGARAWVAELVADPTVVVALDAGGGEVDRQEVEAGDANVSPGSGIEVTEGGSGSGGEGTATTFQEQGDTIPAVPGG